MCVYIDYLILSYLILLSYLNKELLIGFNEKNTKPFWKYVKSTKQENIGIPLQIKCEFKRDISKDKAEIFNNQFKSVFTQDKENDSPSMEVSKYPTIDNFTINTKLG